MRQLANNITQLQDRSELFAQLNSQVEMGFPQIQKALGEAYQAVVQLNEQTRNAFLGTEQRLAALGQMGEANETGLTQMEKKIEFSFVEAHRRITALENLDVPILWQNVDALQEQMNAFSEQIPVGDEIQASFVEIKKWLKMH